MPRTTKKPATPQQPAANGPTRAAVLTLAEAAEYLRLPEDDVLRMVHEQGLHARQVGSEWRFLASAIDDWLRSGPQAKSNKEAWRALVGVWKDDPTADKLREIMAKHRKELDAEGER